MADLPACCSHTGRQLPTADFRILLGPEYGFTQAPPCTNCYRMGSGNSKQEENVVADRVDKSHISMSDFTILRLHGDTGALIAGSLATLLLLYAVYIAVLWRRARMVREAEEGAHAVRVGLGRVAQRAVPFHPAHGLCDDCAERPPQQPDVLQGHFQPV